MPTLMSTCLGYEKQRRQSQVICVDSEHIWSCCYCCEIAPAPPPPKWVTFGCASMHFHRMCVHMNDLGKRRVRVREGALQAALVHLNILRCAQLLAELVCR